MVATRRARRVRASCQFLGTLLDVGGELLQHVVQQHLHHRRGHRHAGLDVDVHREQAVGTGRHHTEQLLLLGEQIALLHHGLDLVLAGVVHGVDIDAFEAVDRGVESHLAGTAVVVAGKHPSALDAFIPFRVPLDVGDDAHDRQRRPR